MRALNHGHFGCTTALVIHFPWQQYIAELFRLNSNPNQGGFYPKLEFFPEGNIEIRYISPSIRYEVVRNLDRHVPVVG
jgi:hypothetical protein